MAMPNANDPLVLTGCGLCAIRVRAASAVHRPGVEPRNTLAWYYE